MSFEWFFQPSDYESEECGGSLVIGLRFDDHDSQMTLRTEADATRTSFFLSAVHDIVNYNGKDYNARTAVLTCYGGDTIEITGLMCESENGMGVSDFLIAYTSRDGLRYTFDLYGTQDMLRFCNSGWDAIARTRND